MIINKPSIHPDRDMAKGRESIPAPQRTLIVFKAEFPKEVLPETEVVINGSVSSIKVEFDILNLINLNLKMATFPKIVLGILIGILLLFSRFDSLWWNYFGSEISTLKSKVSTIHRSEAAVFYKSILKTPASFSYALAGFAAIVLLFLVGQVVQFPKKRLSSVFSVILYIAAVFVHIIGFRPLLSTFDKRYVKPDDEARGLYSIAVWNAITLALLLAIVSNLISAEAVDEEIGAPLVKKQKNVSSAVNKTD